MKHIRFLTLALLTATLAANAGECCVLTNLPACCAKTAAVAPAKFTDKSLYQTESKWTTDSKKEVQLSTLKDKPQVVAMFFANCQFACPIIVNDMKRIEAALPPKARERLGFTLASFDTKRDTPDALAKFRRAYQLPVSGWTLLRGTSDDVQELAALLGLNFKEDANGQFSHSNIITVLNAKGEIVHQLIGLNQDIKETVRLLEKLVAD